MSGLLAWKLRVELARYRGKAVRLIAPVLALAVLTASMWSAVKLFDGLVPVAPRFASAALLMMYAAVGVFQTIAGLRWGVQRFFLSSDLELLLSLPISHSRILALKTAELVAASSVSLLVLVSMTWGYIQATGSPAVLPLAVVSPIALATLAALPATAITILLARVFSGARLRTLVNFLSPLIAASIVLIAPKGSNLFEEMSRGRFAAANLERVGSAVHRLFDAFPTSWVAGIAIGAAARNVTLLVRSVVLVVILLAALSAVSYLLFTRTFHTSWTNASDASRVVGRRRVAERITPPLPLRMRAIIVKEWRTFFRDSRILMTTLFPLLIFGYLTIISIRSGEHGSIIGPMVWLIVFPSTVGSASLLNERRNIALLRAVPLHGIEIIIGKLAAYWLPLAVIAGSVGATLGIVGRRSPAEVAVIVVFVIWTFAWTMAINLAITAFWGKFERERPRLTFAPAMAALAATGLVAATQAGFGLWVAARLGSRVGPLGSPLLGLPLLVLAVGTCAAVSVSCVLAGRRLETIDAV